MIDINAEQIKIQVKNALDEDIGSGDINVQTIDNDSHSKAILMTHEQAILCGSAWFDETFRTLDEKIAISWHCKDGTCIEPQQTLCTIYGKTKALLTGERTAINFLQTLSGTATTTNAYVKKLENYHTILLDTRKTIPGLRLAQKYAVACGGGQNHRFGLHDAILFKENHLLAQKDIIQLNQHRNIEVEVENLQQLKEMLEAGVKHLLLDNFSLESLIQAVKIAKGQAILEVSGNIELDKLQTLAQTGVDYISTGALTKNIRAIDFSMRIAGAEIIADL